jgi:hypothetical protein
VPLQRVKINEGRLPLRSRYVRSVSEERVEGSVDSIPAHQISSSNISPRIKKTLKDQTVLVPWTKD